MNVFGKIAKVAISAVGGLIVAEGLCVVSNALVDDIAHVKSGFDKVIVKPIAPPEKPKKKWGRK